MGNRRTWKDLVLAALPLTPSPLKKIYEAVARQRFNDANPLMTANDVNEGWRLTPNEQAKVRQTLQLLRDDNKVRHLDGALWAQALTQALCKCGEKLPWSLDVVGVGPMDYGCACGRQYTWTGPLDERLLIEAMKPRDVEAPIRRRLLMFGKFEGVNEESFLLIGDEHGYETHIVQKETVAARLGQIKADAVVVLSDHTSHQLSDHGKRIARQTGAAFGEFYSDNSLRQVLGAFERRHPCAGGW